MLESGTHLYFIMNRISRQCRIEIDAIIRMDKEVVIQKIEAPAIKSKTICFLRIYPVDELVLDDPDDFPEFSMAQLWDNCQTVAIGKIFKLVQEGSLTELASPLISVVAKSKQ